MPGVPDTAWGVWGEPDPVKPWEYGSPKLHGVTGGAVSPKFSDTLEWFYERAINPKDKAQCLRLLEQIKHKQQEDKKGKSTLAVHGQIVKARATTKRPSSAKPVGVKSTSFAVSQRPQSALSVRKFVAEPTTASQSQKVQESDVKSTYQRQKDSVDRLSRPKTAKSAQKVSYTSNRPKSAMAAIGSNRYDDPYLTTHEREFPGYSSDLCAETNRPMSTKGFTAPYELSGPIGDTTFRKQFGWKAAAKCDPIRSGTSSGNRRNNPHPHESFMVWKLPNKSTKGMLTRTAPLLQYRDLTDDVLSQILRDQLKSTYQSDYMGIPQGFQVKTAIDAPPHWRTQIKRPRDTTVRHVYDRPEQLSELVGNTTRYGCNKRKGAAALGAVPTVTSHHVKNQEAIKGKTTYDTQYRNRYSQPDLEKLLDNQPNRKAYERFMRYAREAGAAKDGYGSRRRESMTSQNGPKWLTKWEGPHHHEHQ